MCASSRRLLAAAVVLCCLGAGAPAASAAGLDWAACKSKTATKHGFQCATLTVPKDYGSPGRGHFRLAMTRLPASDRAHKRGSLFVNYGGPGGEGVSTTQRAAKRIFSPALLARFDLVSFDPRGVGQSSGAIDCKVDQETQGLLSTPFVTPQNLNARKLRRKDQFYVDACVKRNHKTLPYVSTANVARDMERMRKAVGDRKLTYLGFSYGTFLGATYVSMYPHRVRAAVLDGALDADTYLTRPVQVGDEQTAAFERELDRYFAACAAHPDYCTWAQGDPQSAFGGIVKAANLLPIPAPDPDVTAGDPRAVSGDEILDATIGELYAKQAWPELTEALNEAAAGDASLFRALQNAAVGREDGDHYDPGFDRFFTISAIEGNWPRGFARYLHKGESAWKSFEHFWWNTGYFNTNLGIWPVRGRDLYRGPFHNPTNAAPTLVVGTTQDPATPYRGAERLVTSLGNARLLTMRGDGHTAYGGNSPCIDAAVDGYLLDRAVPNEGAICQQDVPFPPAPEGDATAAGAGSARTAARANRRALRRAALRRQVRPLGRYAAPLGGIR